ncbi:hypothetical protein BDQ12DRAFT_137496 [Crucibulum laeve]|uniref:DUF7708 domain-containing protein n=1 Tax=Crucibulum laeve TaxID=68775 RepID=A0A5C3LF99_9AGAR|nr:hypothetical protein BDQ12DRAFT_137496 [Crucibulum laeve]
MPPSVQRAVPKNEPFHKALEEYVQKLDPIDKAQFLQSHTTSDDVLQTIKSLNEEHRAKSSSRKIISRFSNTIKALEGFFNIIDAAVSASPVAGIVWGSLKIVFQLTHSFTNFFEAVVDVLETLAVELPFYHDYATTLYSQSESMQRALAAVYNDVFSIFTAVRKVFKNKHGDDRKAISVMFQPFRSNLDEIITRLTTRQEVVEREAQHAERLAHQEERDTAAEERQKQETERERQDHERFEAHRERETNKKRSEESQCSSRVLP